MPGFAQDPSCSVRPCSGTLIHQHEWRRPDFIERLRKVKVGEQVFFHPLAERLVDFDGEIVLIFEGGHDPVVLPPMKK